MVISLLQTHRQRVEAEGLFTLKLNPGAGLCWVSGCRKKHADERKKVGDVRFCHRHWQARWRARDFKMAAYRNLKDHAKARKIGFTLTFAKFVSITDAADFWDHQPETDADRLTVDRQDITGPYSDDNVRIIAKGLNSSLGNRERFLSPVVQAILARRRGEPAASWQMTGVREDAWLDDGGDPF